MPRTLPQSLAGTDKRLLAPADARTRILGAAATAADLEAQLTAADENTMQGAVRLSPHSTATQSPLRNTFYGGDKSAKGGI